MNKNWVIWSNEHEAWWAPNCEGYVERLRDAGRYTLEEADDIVQKASYGGLVNGRPSEVAVLDPQRAPGLGEEEEEQPTLGTTPGWDRTDEEKALVEVKELVLTIRGNVLKLDGILKHRVGP